MAKMVSIGGNEIMEKANERASLELAKDGINFTDAAAAAIPTVAYKSMHHTIAVAAEKFHSGSGEPVEVDVMGLFTLVISNRASEDGEKDGNVNIAFVPGPQAKLAVKSDDDTEEGEDD